MLLFFFFSSRRRHTRCALVTGVQTCALPILVLATKRATEREPGLPIGEATLQRGVAALPDRRPLDRERGFDHQCGRGVPGGVERQLSAHLPHMRVPTIGRASCRERVCQYV